MIRTYVDVEGVLRDWLNLQTRELVGVRNPIRLGFHMEQLRSPSKGTYGIVTRLGGAQETSEFNIDPARVSVSILGATREAMGLAAAAYADYISRHQGKPVRVAPDVDLLTVTDVRGPFWNGLDRYVIDAIFHLQPRSTVD